MLELFNRNIYIFIMKWIVIDCGICAEVIKIGFKQILLVFGIILSFGIISLALTNAAHAVTYVKGATICGNQEYCDSNYDAVTAFLNSYNNNNNPKTDYQCCNINLHLVFSSSSLCKCESGYLDCDNNSANGCEYHGSSCPVNPTNSCADTDGGQVFTIKGTVSGYSTVSSSSYSHTDSCSGNMLTEWYCSGTSAASVTHDCTQDGKICSNGACVLSSPSPTPTPTPSCASDYGNPCSSGRYCSGSIVEYKSGTYDCSGSCVYDTTHTVVNCASKQSVDSDGSSTAYFIAGNVLDYTGCNNGACTSKRYKDSCSGNTLTEFGATGASFVSHTKDCTDYNFCDKKSGFVYNYYPCYQPLGGEGACIDTKHNPDEGQLYCTGCGLTWLKSGEDSAFGSYTHFGQNGCCGNNPSENVIKSNIDSTEACCNAPNACVYSGHCIAYQSIATINGKSVICGPNHIAKICTYSNSDATDSSIGQSYAGACCAGGLKSYGWVKNAVPQSYGSIDMSVYSDSTGALTAKLPENCIDGLDNNCGGKVDNADPLCNAYEGYYKFDYGGSLTPKFNNNIVSNRGNSGHTYYGYMLCHDGVDNDHNGCKDGSPVKSAWTENNADGPTIQTSKGSVTFPGGDWKCGVKQTWYLSWMSDRVANTCNGRIDYGLTPYGLPLYKHN